MDNAEILEGMGFDFVTGITWEHEDFGFINISPKSDLTEIASVIFNNGYVSCQNQVKKVLSIK